MKKYHQAADVCQHEGGDLIRLDSLTKHNIMRSFVGKYKYFQFVSFCDSIITLHIHFIK